VRAVWAQSAASGIIVRTRQHIATGAAAMATKDFVASHAKPKDAVFVRGLRPFFDYRDLGIKKATQGRVVAHVIRAVDGAD
jgi:hypothetical protein